MKRTKAPKTARQTTTETRQDASAGRNGMSLTPPASGMDFLDRGFTGSLTPPTPVQLQPDLEEEELLQGKFDRNVAPIQFQTTSAAGENRTGMPVPLKAGLEQLSGLDLSGVRVHYNSDKPAQLNALAYTQGQDIEVGPGQERHLPHEGWHAVQQMQGRVQPTMQAKGVSINDDPALEREADLMGEKAGTQKSPDRFPAPQGEFATNEDGLESLSIVISQQTPIQRRFVGEPDAHHLHIEIHQDHYKYGNDRGSRIEIGKNGNYKLDQLIVARNYLNDNPGGDGHAACLNWLEEECGDHADWTGDYVPSWEADQDEDNPHVEGIFEYAEGFGISRADLENAMIQARNEALEEESRRLGTLDSNLTGGTTAQEIEDFLEEVELKPLLASWGGFAEDIYDKQALLDHFCGVAKDKLQEMLLDEFPLLEQGKQYNAT